MYPFSLGVMTVLQGLYSILWIAVLLDVASPAFNMQNFPDWTGVRLAISVTVLFGAASVLGVVMHTLSRNLFRHQKDLWEFQILTSHSVVNRFKVLELGETSIGGPTLKQILDKDNPDRVRLAGELMHAMDYILMTRSPEMFKLVQVYRDQYRLARGFILPSAALAAIVPFWEPIRLIEGARTVGPFSTIGLQLLLMGFLIASVTFLAFRERVFRYAAARVMSFVTGEGERKTPWI
jgi:hypothetical protein